MSSPDAICPAAAACGYELLAPIGSGAYGTVYLARKAGRWFAVKWVRLGEEPDARTRFAREWRGVQTAARLSPVEGLAAVRDLHLADVGLLADVRETASIVGTPGYAPPEGTSSAGGDVYSLGRTLWRISTGRPPADASLPPCAEAEVESPYFWQWLALLARATARDPALRPRSAKALLKDLRRLRRSMRLHRHRWLRWAAWAAVLALAAPLAWTFPDFAIWRSQGDEYCYHMNPPRPWRWIKPFYAPREDPMKLGVFHTRRPPQSPHPSPQSPKSPKSQKSPP